MRFRSAAGETDPSTRESPPDATDSSSSESPVRTFLFVAAGAAAVAYAVSRLRSSGDDGGVDASLETVRDRTAATVPDAVEERVAAAVPTESQPIPIGVRGSDDGEGSEGADSGAEFADTGDAAPIDESDVNADLADEPSPTKVSSGTSEEIQDKPAEPGEMAVDEDVEELVDDVDGEEADAEESETEESGTDESELSETDESDADEE
ncbi:hypothetical protein C477_16585 [Haloterrigena salina JCM 13891]|uniref:Uncharacterized protein n=1 Tax=Haloterrigena salina JCM 13891 TaxID=1227488 RepID=M0C2I5_9EURY|nr:hypothetical protein [Haloterrigena salina]ELZ16129.1 hypothetical protein C477_16585 [Haloterrigena salina JCM 13891]